MIACHGVTKEFDKTTVLQGVSFEIGRGRICALVGPNGAGKSTLVKILTGELRATNGTAYVNGVCVAEKRRELRRIIGVVPKDLALLDDLTIEEHFFLSGPIYGIAKKDTKARTDQLVRILGLEYGRRTFLRDCSYGMRKKTALGLALLHSPAVVMLDEPFEGVDPITSEVIREMLQQMSSRGITVLLTSHILTMVTRVAHDLLLLKNGSIMWMSEMTAVPGSVEELYFRTIEAPVNEDLPWLRSSQSS